MGEASRVQMGNDCSCGRTDLEKASGHAQDFSSSTEAWINSEAKLNEQIVEVRRKYFDKESDQDVQAVSDLLQHHKEDVKGMLESAKQGSIQLKNTFDQLDSKHKEMEKAKKEMDDAEANKKKAETSVEQAEKAVQEAEAAVAKATEEAKLDLEKKVNDKKSALIDAKKNLKDKETELNAKTASYEKKRTSWQTEKKKILKDGASAFFGQCIAVTQNQLNEFQELREKVRAIDTDKNEAGKEHEDGGTVKKKTSTDKVGDEAAGK